MSLAAFVEEGQPLENLFVPFADLTTGKETYPAGRYLDLHPTSTGFYNIDFNLAYNPTCAYNATYDCPYPPAVEPLEGRDPRRRKGARHVTSALQAVIFDFDGVIADSEPLHFRAFQQALAEDGLELTPKEYYARYLGYDDVGMFQAFGEDRGVPMDARARPGARRAQGHQAAGDARRRLRCSFPARSTSCRAAAGAVPIAIASGALRHEIDEVIDAAGVARPVRRHRRLRRHAGEQAVAGALSAGVRAAAGSHGRHARSAALRRDRGFALGARIRTGSRVTLCRSDQQLSGR